MDVFFIKIKLFVIVNIKYVFYVQMCFINRYDVIVYSKNDLILKFIIFICLFVDVNVIKFYILGLGRLLCVVIFGLIGENGLVNMMLDMCFFNNLVIGCNVELVIVWNLIQNGFGIEFY